MSEEVCPKCENTRINVYQDEEGYVFAKPCECANEYDFKRRIKKSGLLNVIEDYTFDKFEVKGIWQKTVKDKALSFVDNTNGNWFYIGGQVGSGKTMICTAIVGKLIKRGLDAHYMMYRQEIMELKMGMEDFMTYSKKLNYLKTVKVLYIDDLFKGTNQPTEADLRIVFDLLNYRYVNRELITIISTEKSIADIMLIDEAIGSRIYQRSKDYAIKLAQNPDLNMRMK